MAISHLTASTCPGKSGNTSPWETNGVTERETRVSHVGYNAPVITLRALVLPRLHVVVVGVGLCIDEAHLPAQESYQQLSLG